MQLVTPDPFSSRFLLPATGPTPGGQRTVKKLLMRLWTGLVGGMLGACLAVVGMVVVLMMGFELNAALWLLTICVIPGIMVGVLFGNRPLGRSKQTYLSRFLPLGQHLRKHCKLERTANVDIY